MSPAPERLKTPEALALIRKYADKGVRVLGIEGFVVVPQGLLAGLDLILDVSDAKTSPSEASVIAESFVRTNDRPNVVWEVWGDD